MAKDIWELLANPKLNKCLPEGLLGVCNLRVSVVSVSERLRVIKTVSRASCRYGTCWNSLKLMAVVFCSGGCWVGKSMETKLHNLILFWLGLHVFRRRSDAMNFV